MRFPDAAQSLLDELRASHGPFFVSRVVMRLPPDPEHHDEDELCHEIRDIAAELGAPLGDR